MQNTMTASGLKCIFHPYSQGGADAYINSIVKKNPGSIIVVANDEKDIGRFCRSLGAKVVSMDFLISKPKHDKNKDDKNIGNFIKNRINEELTKE